MCVHATVVIISGHRGALLSLSVTFDLHSTIHTLPVVACRHVTVRNSIHKYVFTLKKHPSVGAGSIAFSLPQVGEAAAGTLVPTNSPSLELRCSLLAVLLLWLSHSVCHCLVFVHLPSLCLLSILKLGSHSGTKVVLSPPPDALI